MYVGGGILPLPYGDSFRKCCRSLVVVNRTVLLQIPNAFDSSNVRSMFGAILGLDGMNLTASYKPSKPSQQDGDELRTWAASATPGDETFLMREIY